MRKIVLATMFRGRVKYNNKAQCHKIPHRYTPTGTGVADVCPQLRV